MTDEIFAPVVALVPVTALDAAIDLVNAGRYGLQAGVFTQDIDVGLRRRATARVGGVMINDTSSYHADAMPYGGVKDSGYGVEGPKYAVEDMTDPRIIVLNLRAPGRARRRWDAGRRLPVRVHLRLAAPRPHWPTRCA